MKKFKCFNYGCGDGVIVKDRQQLRNEDFSVCGNKMQ